MKKRIIATLLCMNIAGIALGCGTKPTPMYTTNVEADIATTVDTEISSDGNSIDSTSDQTSELSTEDLYITRYSKDDHLFISDSEEFYKNLLLTSMDAELELKEKGETLENVGIIWNEKINNTVEALKASPELSAENKEKLDELMSQWGDFEPRFHKLWYNVYNQNGYVHGSMYTEMMPDQGATKYELFEGALMALEYEVTGSNVLTLNVISESADPNEAGIMDFADYDVCLGIEHGTLEKFDEMGIADMGESEWRNIAADMASVMKEIGSEDSDGLPYVVNYVRLTKLMNELEEGVCSDYDKTQTAREHRFQLLAMEMLNTVVQMAADCEIAGEPIMDEECLDEEQECYHVSIKRPVEKADEYDHFFDCFFAKGTYAGVFYASKSDDMNADRYVFDACDFKAEYIDVTLDGNKDIVISLGHQGAAGTEVHCAYVYEDGGFVYRKSFENIPNYGIAHNGTELFGLFNEKATSYVYINGEFVEG